MPANNTRSTVLQVATALLNSGASPAALFGKGQSIDDGLIGKLVSHLQTPDYSITDLFQDVAAAKEKIVAAGLPPKQLASHWSTLDRTVESARWSRMRNSSVKRCMDIASSIHPDGPRLQTRE